MARAMNRQKISERFDSFLRLQALCGGIILASWLIFWAVENPVGNIPDLFIYVLTQVNLTVLLLHPLKQLYEGRSSRYHWPVHVVAILAVNCMIVIVSAAVIYRVDDLNLPFIDFLRHSWKFPFVANLVFAFAYEGYKVTTRRLRKRNQQLQQTIELRTAEREHDEAELQQAREIQRGLLPREIPQLPGFEITGMWEPARVVGGDYYDVIQLGKDKLGVCIADVVGKGVSAALLMANVQASLRAFASEYAPPSYVCSRINSVLCSNLAEGKFVTLFYGVLDQPTRTLQYTNAGHPFPVLIDSHGKARRLDNSGALLGVIPDWKYEDSEVVLEPGDRLLLFTDGITEAPAPDGEEFGESRLIAAVTTSTEQSLDDLRSQVMDEVKGFCNLRMHDDATLVLIAAACAHPDEMNLATKLNSDRQPLQYAGAQP